MVFSVRRRAIYKWRSKAVSSIPSGALTKICSITGSDFNASFPHASESVGTIRQPTT